MKHLVIAGAGKLGRELYWNIQSSVGYGVEFDIKGYIVDCDPEDESLKLLCAPVIGDTHNYCIQDDDVFICAIGSCDGRAAVAERLSQRGAEFINIIHNTAIVQGQVKLGRGIILGPYTVVGDSVTIGNHVMLNTHSAVGHDTIIGDYTCAMSFVDITGCCKIGKRVYFGSGARMVPGSIIEDNAFVGIGSVVLRRVKAGRKVFGNPAKTID